MKKTITFDNEELSIILYAIIATKQNVSSELLAQFDTLLDKIQNSKFDK